MPNWIDILFPPRTDESALRNVSTEAFLALAAPRPVCKTDPETVAILPFSAAPVRAALHEAKYHGNEKAFLLLAAALADYVRDADALGFSAGIRIAPVPLGRKRRRERGYNQVEEIARRALKGIEGIALDTDLLVRTRETASQVSLPRRDRMENMRGAFRAARPIDRAYTYIVLDDVLTTGATLQAAIDALRQAGAGHIVPLALAH